MIFVFAHFSFALIDFSFSVDILSLENYGVRDPLSHLHWRHCHEQLSSSFSEGTVPPETTECGGGSDSQSHSSHSELSELGEGWCEVAAEVVSLTAVSSGRAGVRCQRQSHTTTGVSSRRSPVRWVAAAALMPRAAAVSTTNEPG